MNEPLINPIWFYLIDISENFEMIFSIVGGMILLGILLIAALFFAVHDTDKKFHFPLPIFIIGIIMILISGLLPTKETCYKIIIASYITPENIESLKNDSTLELIDYITEKVNEICNKEESD